MYRHIGTLVLAASGLASPCLAGAIFQGLGGHIAQDVSGDGSTVVGADYTVINIDPSPTVAWRWTAAQGKVFLPTLSGTTGAVPWGVSFDGSVVAGRGERANGGPLALVWGPQGLRSLGDGHAMGGVSADGSVVAGAVDYDGSGLSTSATRWTLLPSGTAIRQRLSIDNAGTNGISGDGRVAVGGSGGPVRWVGPAGTMERLGFLPGMTAGGASGASYDGSVVVGGVSDGVTGEAFRWTVAGGMVGLGDLPGGNVGGTANDTTADGSIVVGNGHSGEGRRAFIWDEAHGMRGLEEVFEQEWGLDLGGWQLERANGISDDGRVITGVGLNPAGLRESWVAVVPEPSAGALVVLAGLSLLRRRRALPTNLGV